MDKININNLFSKNKLANKERPLDIKSLFANNNNTRIEKKVSFSIEKLLNHKEEKIKRTREQYRKIYNMILNKIDTVSKINDTTDIIYDVPECIIGFKDYNSIECLEYLENKLRSVYFMDTLKLSNKSIFISWKHIVRNRDKYLEGEIKNKD